MPPATPSFPNGQPVGFGDGMTWAVCFEENFVQVGPASAEGQRSKARGMPSAECKTQNAKRKTQNAKRKTQNAKRKTPNAKRHTPNAKGEAPDSIQGNQQTPPATAASRTLNPWGSVA
jgi:hypothetical protein